MGTRGGASRKAGRCCPCSPKRSRSLPRRELEAAEPNSSRPSYPAIASPDEEDSWSTELFTVDVDGAWLAIEEQHVDGRVSFTVTEGRTEPPQCSFARLRTSSTRSFREAAASTSSRLPSRTKYSNIYFVGSIDAATFRFPSSSASKMNTRPSPRSMTTLSAFQPASRSMTSTMTSIDYRGREPSRPFGPSSRTGTPVR